MNKTINSTRKLTPRQELGLFIYTEELNHYFRNVSEPAGWVCLSGTNDDGTTYLKYNQNFEKSVLYGLTIRKQLGRAFNLI